MKAAEAPLLSIIEGMKHFVVPLFQRPYSWKTRDWEALWDDVLDTYSAFSNGMSARHFLGSIVSKSMPSTPEGVSPFLLIDGQQRLTTLAILLAAIRDAAKPNSPNLAEKIEQLYLRNAFGKGLEQYKILPTQADRPAFFAVVAGEDDAGQPAGRIRDACRYFRDAISRGDEDGAPLDIQKLEQVVTGRLELVSITLAESDNEYRIFESLNTRASSSPRLTCSATTF